MHKILFVCHGNICRSPMAEFVLKQKVKERGLSGQFQIDSAATSAEEIGNPVHPGTRRELHAHGIACNGKHAVQLRGSDYERYDLLIGMDARNVSNMRRICGGDPDGKIRLLLAYAGEPRDIADPWYTGNFHQTYADVERGCEALLNTIL